MPDNEPAPSGIILYQTEDGHAGIQSRFDVGTILAHPGAGRGAVSDVSP